MSDQEIEIHLPSALYPFRLDDLPEFEFGAYTLKNVYQNITEQQQQACVEMWLRNRVIPNEQAALERSKQVCYFITETASEKLIGVNTLYAGQVMQGGPQIYLNRMFIDPKYRDSRLMITGTAMMLCFAKTHLADEGYPGVVNINENKKLSRPGMNRIFERLGYTKKGMQNGQVVLFYEFDRIKLVEQLLS